MTNRIGAGQPPPGTLNVVIALVAYAAAGFFLWLATRGGTYLVLSAVAYSFVGNTIFSLLHESVHGKFHSSNAVNDVFGCVSAAFFPTGFTFQRICHFGHHRRNRTDAEMFDYYYPGDSRLLKCYRLYSLLTGFYWLAIPIGCLLYLLFPALATSAAVRERVVRPTGLGPMLADLKTAPTARTRMEITFTIAFQVLLVCSLKLSLLSWLCCYAAFALNWCSLQYTDHAWTVRDVKNGASNLKVNKAVQYIFLNYHHHLAHHQNPQVSWIRLHKFVDFTAARPGFLKTYLSLWRGPRMTMEPPPRAIDADLQRQVSPGPRTIPGLGRV